MILTTILPIVDCAEACTSRANSKQSEAKADNLINRLQTGTNHTKSIFSLVLTAYLRTLQKFFTGLVFMALSWLQIVAQNHQVHFFTTADGLVSSDLTDVHVDRHGYIWCTSDGACISRFDGLRFYNYDDEDQLENLSFYTIYEENESLWFGGENVVAHYYLDQWRCFEVEGIVQAINQVNDSSLVLSTSAGIQLMRPDRPEEQPFFVTHDPAFCSIDWGDALWVGTSEGILVFENGQWSVHDSSIVADASSQFCEDQHGQLWFNSQDPGLCLWENGTFRPVSPDVSQPVVTALAGGSLGSMILGTATQGVWVWQPLSSLWQPMQNLHTISTRITGLSYDPWDHLWMATEGQGLVRYAPQTFLFHTRSSGLQGDWVQSIQPEHDGVRIIYRSSKTEVLSAENALHNEIPFASSVTILAQTRDRHDGNWWATSTGLFYETDSSLIEVTDPLHNAILAHQLIAVDSSQVYALGSSGILRIGKNYEVNQPHFRVERLVEQDGLSAMVKAANGIWCYGPSYLGFTSVITSPLVEEVDLAGLAITSLTPLDNDRVLLGTRNQSIYVLDRNAEKSPLRLENADLPTQIRSVLLERNGVWFSTRNKIYRMHLTADLEVQNLRVFGSDQGLPAVEFLSGQAAAANDRVYFPTRTGVVELLAQDIDGLNKKPNVFFRYVEVQGRRMSIAELEQSGARIPYAHNAIEVTVGAVDHQAPQGLVREWRLDGWTEDEVWHALGRDETLHLAALAPGSYHLKLRAKGGHGVYADTQQLTFRILKPFWWQTWFLILLMVTFFGLVYILYRYRIKVALARNRQRQEKLERKNKLLALEQSARQLQMNPHFIFNALNSIQAKVTSGKREEARSDIQSFATLMRQMLDQTRHEWISLEVEIETLRTYLEIEQNLKGNNFDFQIKIPSDMDTSFYQVPPMLIQPFVENAVKHGLPSNNQGRIEIDFAWKGRFLRCQVIDNGIGFNGESPLGAGIEITRQRLMSYFGDENMEPLVFEIPEVDGIPAGTSVTILLPVR